MRNILLTILGFLTPLSTKAQMSAKRVEKQTFTTGAGVDMLETKGGVFIMDYNTKTGYVNGEKVTITAAKCEANTTIVQYTTARNEVFKLVFKFNLKGKYTDFNLSPLQDTTDSKSVGLILNKL